MKDPEGKILFKIVKKRVQGDFKKRRETLSTLVYVRDQEVHDEFLAGLSRIQKDPKLVPYEFRPYNFPGSEGTFDFRFRIPNPGNDPREMARLLVEKLKPLVKLGIANTKYSLELPLVSRESDINYKGILIVKPDDTETEEDQLRVVVVKTFLTDASWDDELKDDLIYCSWEPKDPHKKYVERKKKKEEKKVKVEEKREKKVEETKEEVEEKPKKKSKKEKKEKVVKEEVEEKPKEKKKLKSEPVKEETTRPPIDWYSDVEME